MSVQYYRDEDLPFFELKFCDISDLCYKKHSHEEYSLGIVDEGESLFWCEGKQFARVSPGSLVLIPPDIVHACNPRQANHWKYKMLFLQPGWVGRCLAEEGCGPLQAPLVRDTSGQIFFRAIGCMLESLTAPATPLEKEAGIMTVLAQVFQEKTAPQEPASRRDQPELRLIREYLHSSYLDKITLDELEQLSGLNKFRIIRSFKDQFDIPPHTYQTMLRVNHAKRELRKSRPVADVACESGFYDQSHFTKVFKSHTGVTPERYQKML